MARHMGITPGSEDWCDIWLCNLLSRYFHGPITIVRQSSAEGKGWGRDSCTESHMPFVRRGEVRGIVRVRGQDGLATAGGTPALHKNAGPVRWAGGQL